jgi:hypothetical protein
MTGPRVAIMQPYFLPSIVYFHLLQAADIFVFFDDVQFVTKRFTHRNRLTIGKTDYRFAVPLAGRSQNKCIDEIDLHPELYMHWRRKFLTTLRRGFARDEVIEELAELTGDPDIGLARLAERSVRWAAGRIGLSPSFLRSSELDYDREGDATCKIVSICRELGAASYVNAWGGRDLYDRSAFMSENINLRFCRPGDLPEGLSRESILKPLLTREADEVRALAGRYELVGGAE